METATTEPVATEDFSDTRRRDVSFDEHREFRTVAVVDVLPHNRIRIEELGELSDHNLIQYQLIAAGEPGGVACDR